MKDKISRRDGDALTSQYIELFCRKSLGLVFSKCRVGEDN